MQDDHAWEDEEITLAAPLDDPLPAQPADEEFADAELIDDGEGTYEATAYDESPAHPRGRRIPFEVFFFLTTLFLLLCVGVTAAGLLIYFRPDTGRRTSGGTNSASQFVATTDDAKDRPHSWLPADQGALHMGDTKVEIVRAEFSPARGKDSSGFVQVTDQSYLQIIVRVENTAFQPIEYQSWYGNDFLTDAGPVRIRLHDAAENEFPWAIFSEFERVRWHNPNDTIEPRKYIEDVIIFEVPPNVDPRTVASLRLALPAAALGREGFYYFELPRDMIVDF